MLSFNLHGNFIIELLLRLLNLGAADAAVFTAFLPFLFILARLPFTSYHLHLSFQVFFFLLIDILIIYLVFASSSVFVFPFDALNTILTVPFVYLL